MVVAEKKSPTWKPEREKKERQPGAPMTRRDLIKAISMGKASEVEEWFSSGDRDPNDAETDNSTTLLSRAMTCSWSHWTFGTKGAAARKGGIQIARGLIARGADVNRPTTRSYETVLHIAARLGTAESVNFLLDNGAELESADKYGITPLMNSCRACVERDCIDTVLALLKRGASLDAVNNEGDGVLDFLVGENFYDPEDRRYGDGFYTFEEAKAALAEIKDAGGWKSYAREPRRELLALRVLCEQGRASPPEAFMPVELLASGVLSAETFDDAKSLARSATCAPLPILKRLFPAAAAPPELDEAQGAKRYRVRDGADAGVFSKELFWHILSYWHTLTDDAVVLRDAVRRDHEDHVRRSENGGDY